MNTRLLPPGLHSFETLQPGDYFDTDTAQITPALIQSFADLTGDHFAVHLSDAGAQAHGFAGQVAHGLLVLALVEGLKSRAPVQFAGFAALSWDWQFTAPVLAGDSIHARISVQSKRSAGPRSGLLTLQIQVFNQHGHNVQSGQTRVMTRRNLS